MGDEVTKLTDDEFSKIKSFREENERKVYEFGHNTAVILSLEKELDFQKLTKDRLVSEFHKLKQDEVAFFESLRIKYPNTNINIETGEIIKNT